MMSKNLGFDNQRNRFKETAGKKDDAQYLEYRGKNYRKDNSPKTKGMGYFIFLIIVFLAAYVIFSQFVFAA